MACELNQKDNTGADFTNCDFSNRDLSGYIFKSCKLAGTNFSKSTFNGETDFTGATFGKSATDKVTNFSGCDLSAAKFSKPVLFGKSGTKKIPADLTNAKIPWTLLGNKFEAINISGAVLQDMPADLSKLRLTNVKWNNADLTGKNIGNAHFTSCDLTGSKMSGVNLNHANFLKCDLTSVKMDRCSMNNVIFDGSTLTNTDLSYASSFIRCSFLNTLLKGTQFDGNDLKDSTFNVPNMMSEDPAYITSFKGATLSSEFLIKNLRKNWQCIDFRNAKIDGWDSLKSDMYNIKAMHSYFNSSLSFKNAGLSGADFSDAIFNAVDFSNTQLNNTRFIDARTLRGNEMGKNGALFFVASDDTGIPSQFNFTAFSEALNKSKSAELTTIFNRFGIVLGANVTEQTTDPISKNAAWKITDNAATPKNIYIVVKSPLAAPRTGFELLIYNNSPSLFSYAHMIGAFMEGCDFTNANMEHVQLYGATITYATLNNANLTGAQLGTNATIFAIAQNDTSAQYGYEAFLKAMETPVLDGIVSVFGHYGYRLSDIECRVAPNREGAEKTWTITDKSVTPSKNYAVALTVVDPSPKKYEIKVFFDGARPAILDYSNMACVTLTQANLTACSLRSCQLYNNGQTGQSAMLNQTNLADAVLDGANLYYADFTGATLSGTSFANTNLMGAMFKNVVLNAGSNGRSASFTDANLQGTDFSAATIMGANFMNAAISLPIPGVTGNVTNGVPLRRILKKDVDFSACLDELNSAASAIEIDDPTPWQLASILNGKNIAAVQGILAEKNITISERATITSINEQSTWQIKGKGSALASYNIVAGYDDRFTVAYNVIDLEDNEIICNIPYTTALGLGAVSTDLANLLKANSTNKIKLPAEPTLEKNPVPNIWKIDDGPRKNYIVWQSVKLSGGATPTLGRIMIVRTPFSALRAAFQKFGGLREQSTVRKPEMQVDNTITWILDVGKNDAFYTNTGYVQFKIVASPAVNPEFLDIYGYTMRTLGVGTNGLAVFRDFNCDPTLISEDRMDDQTMLPNNSRKYINKEKRRPFNEWMFAYREYVEPPTCVPTDISYCPAPVVLRKQKKSNNMTVTDTNYGFEPDELPHVRTWLANLQSLGPQLFTDANGVNKYFYALTKMGNVYPNIKNNSMRWMIDKLYDDLSQISNNDKMTVLSQYYNYCSQVRIDVPPDNARGMDGTWPWRNYWFAFLNGFAYIWCYDYDADQDDQRRYFVSLDIPEHPTNRKARLKKVVDDWGLSPSADELVVGSDIRDGMIPANAAKVKLDAWWTTETKNKVLVSLTNAQRDKMRDLITSTDPLSIEQYFFIFHSLIAYCSLNTTDQEKASAIASTVTSSDTYPDDTFINHLVYIALIYIADPRGQYKWNHEQLKGFLNDTLNVIQGTDAGSTKIKAAIKLGLDMLNADVSYPLQDPYSSAPFITRKADTLAALDDARKKITF